MNIVEAYIKFHNQLVIFVSGVSGSGITHLAKILKDDLKLELVSYAPYVKKELGEQVTLPDGSTTINYDTDNTIDWDGLNKEINEKKAKGVIVYGPSFPSNKLDPNLKVDFHIRIKVPKKNLFERREKYGKSHGLQDPNALFIFNKYTFPYYLQGWETNQVTKTINVYAYVDKPDDEYDNSNADEAFEYVIGEISKWLRENKKSGGSANSAESESAPTSESSEVSDSDDDVLTDEEPTLLVEGF